MRIVACVAALAAAVLVTAVAPDGPTAGRFVAQAMSRAEIRSMPLLERPDRPGHFYGNAVRRRHRGTPATPQPARPGSMAPAAGSRASRP